MAVLTTQPTPAQIDSLRGVLNVYKNQHGQIVCRAWVGRDQSKKTKTRKG